jgi:hypothetical protein
MVIRQAGLNDVSRLVEIDKAAYGETGGTEGYFRSKISSFPEGVIVAEDKGIVTGFVVFEVYKDKEVPADFCEMDIKERLSGKWMFVAAFTTATNYLNSKEDSELLLKAEGAAKRKGCVCACVPLSKKHPFDANGVFEFWEGHKYKKVGTIKWVAGPHKLIDCFFLTKRLG